MKPALFAILSLFGFASLSSAAGSTPIPKISLNDSTQYSVSNSVFELYGLTATHLENLKIEVTLSTFTQESVSKTDSNGNFDIVLGLTKGPGIYRVSVYHADTFDRDGYSNMGALIKSFRIQNSDTRNEKYLLPSARVQSASLEIQNLEESILSAHPDAVDDVKIALIHDWVSTHIAYDYDKMNRANGGGATLEGNDALNTLHEGSGICYNYANLFAALARAAGFRTRVITGLVSTIKAPNNHHAWNEVYLNRQWAIVDTTWDAGKLAKHDYLFPSQEFFELTHSRTQETND